MSEWEKKTLGEVVNLKRGYDLPQSQRLNGDIPIYSSSGISGFHDKYKALNPGVITGRYGTIGNIYFANAPYWPLNTTLYVEDFKGNNEVFIYYFLKQINWSGFSDKSAVPGVNRNDVHKENILLPSLPIQKKIADILSCLDRKIENLRRQNETLEEIARSIFKHWFIDFEFPNADGKPYKSSGGVMVRSELGDIPEGWHIKRFDSLGELNRGKSRHRPRYAEHLYGGTYPFIQTGDIKASQGFITEYEQTYNDAGLAQSRLWKDETLCITIAANIAETGILTFPTCFPDSVIGFVADSSICDVYFIHRMFKYKKKEIEVESIGSVQKNLNLETIAKIKFITPDIKKHNDLVAVFRKLGSKIICSKQKIRTLTKIRDTLLPKLMSGQLRVEG
jgi:type I restriction enzyme, S subunit